MCLRDTRKVHSGMHFHALSSPITEKFTGRTFVLEKHVRIRDAVGITPREYVCVREDYRSILYLPCSSVQRVLSSILPIPDICQAGTKGRRTLPHKERVGPLVRGAIRTHIAYAFVVVAVACRIRTGDIEENATGSASLSHTSLRVSAWKHSAV
jgi:hypothetical protein